MSILPSYATNGSRRQSSCRLASLARKTYSEYTQTRKSRKPRSLTTMPCESVSKLAWSELEDNPFENPGWITTLVDWIVYDIMLTISRIAIEYCLNSDDDSLIMMPCASVSKLAWSELEDNPFENLGWITTLVDWIVFDIMLTMLTISGIAIEYCLNSDDDSQVKLLLQKTGGTNFWYWIWFWSEPKAWWALSAWAKDSRVEHISQNAQRDRQYGGT